MVTLMATNVSLAILAHRPSRFVFATVPETQGFWQKVWGKPLADRSSAPLESWDFDCDAGTLVVTSVTESLEVPLAALTRLRFAGVEATASDSYCDYQLQLFHDNGSPLGSMVTLPSSTHFRAKRPNEVRSALARLRAFVKPSCPKLEGTVFEEVVRWFTMGHQQRVQRMGELVGKLQAALEVMSQHPQTPGMDVARWRETLQGYQDKLKHPRGCGKLPDGNRGIFQDLLDRNEPSSYGQR
jgi:hypothetical protein